MARPPFPVGPPSCSQEDLAEFNQCQTQLVGLYRDGYDRTNEPEFTAYRILYQIYLSNSAGMLHQAEPSQSLGPSGVSPKFGLGFASAGFCCSNQAQGHAAD
jgi:hypothetical protein